MNANSPFFDYILVGGGLQSGLMALAIRHHQPQATLAIIEQDSQLAGNHTWSFHASDVAGSFSTWFEPLIEGRWPKYETYIGGMPRTVNLEYQTISSAHFVSVVTRTLSSDSCRILTGTSAKAIENNRVILQDGSQLEAAVVFDNRGPNRLDMHTYTGGFQKFWGFEIELAEDWPFSCPIVMDDRIDQSDGFRFIYSLPFERRRVLVEDTRFSNTTTIDRDECLGKVEDYLKQLGVSRWQIVREESGVLPMPTGGALPGSGLPTLAGGYRGAWFHAATGYSFPLCIAVADLVARAPASQLTSTLKQLANEHRGRARFARFLNRLLFDLVKPKKRYQIFRRFYKVLDETRIARFFGHRFNFVDGFRIIIGIPPGGLRPLNFFRSLIASRNPTATPSLPTSVDKVPA
jgi:lycopene beta-cyclase